MTIDNGEDTNATLDVDVSSSRLDDDTAVSFVERMVSVLQAKVDDVSSTQQKPAYEHQKVLVKLTLDMNKITPLGVSKIFDLLVNDGDKNSTPHANATESEVETTSNETKTTDDDGNTTTLDNNAAMSLQVQDELDTTTNERETKSVVDPIIQMDGLDLSFNDFGGHGVHSPDLQLLCSVRRLFEKGGDVSRSNDQVPMLLVPRVLTLENCGIGAAFCRSIGRGILNSFENESNNDNREGYRPSILRVGGNQAIGDAGAVALAASFRLAVPSSYHQSGLDDNEHSTQHVMEELDISSCGVGDAGAEAFALAIAFNPGCLTRLDLSNNKITDVGAIALGRALVEANRLKVSRGDKSSVALEELVLDNNVGIGDEGCAALAGALACGAVKAMSIRSCTVRAEGASAFGKAIKSLEKKYTQTIVNEPTHFSIDISGNQFGTFLTKKKKGAAMLRDKASSHMSFISKSLQSRWKGAGSSMGLTAESDDDEESVMGGIIDEEGGEKLLLQIARCGARSFCGEILNDEESTQKQPRRAIDYPLSLSVGMRQCCLDQGALDALSASIVNMKESGVDLAIDVSMNRDVEQATVDALQGEKKENDLLQTMAENHNEALDIIRQARQRSALASQSAADRARVEMEFGRSMFDDASDYDQYDEYQ